MVMIVRDDGLYEGSIVSVFKKKMGRKKSGTFKLHMLSGTSDTLPAVASDITIGFKSRTESEVIEDDPVTIDDLVHADLPWSGDIVLCNDDMDNKFTFHARVRNVVRFDKFIFQLRELDDGKPYQDGLVEWTIFDSPAGFNYDIRSGLKQPEVVEMFQGYYDGVEALEQYLVETGYEKNDRGWSLFGPDGDLVSELGHSLMGVMFFKSIN